MACVRVYAQPLDLKLDQPRVSSWLLYYRQYYYHHHHFLYHSQIFPLQPFPSYLGQNTYYCNKLMSMIKSFSCTEMTLGTTSLIWKRSICGRKFVTNCLQRGKKGMNRTPTQRHACLCLPEDARMAFRFPSEEDLLLVRHWFRVRWRWNCYIP